MTVDTGPTATANNAQVTGQRHTPPGHAALPGRRVAAAWFAVFAVYAAAMIFTRHADGTWAAWGCGGYAAAALLLLAPTGWVIPLAAALGGALIAPLLWLITTFPPTGEVVVIGQSASYLLRHGTPYLPPTLITGWTSYNPYLPLMEVFGLPRSAGLPGVLGDPRIWTTLATVVAGGAAFAVASPHRVRDCPHCRRRVAWLTAVALASPLIAFPLAVGVTDPPIIALTCLVLAWAGQGRLVRAGVVLGVACAMKTTAWAVVPVLAVMAWVRYAPRGAARLTVTTVLTGVVLALLAAPEALATPAALKQNLIDYPLGLSKFKTVAASPLPGHLIAGLGHGGRLTVDVLLVVAVAAFVGWLLLRPPRDERDATVRLAVGYAVMFILDPSTRFGYFAYPLALLGWLALTKSNPRSDNPERSRGFAPPELRFSPPRACRRAVVLHPVRRPRPRRRPLRPPPPRRRCLAGTPCLSLADETVTWLAAAGSSADPRCSPSPPAWWRGEARRSLRATPPVLLRRGRVRTHLGGLISPAAPDRAGPAVRSELARIIPAARPLAVLRPARRTVARSGARSVPVAAISAGHPVPPG